MAIYHFPCTMTTRSKGQFSVAANTYQIAEKTLDTRTGTIHNFIKNKADLIHQVIQMPQQWIAHRDKLWNMVERAEKRKNTQLARKFAFALSLELSANQNIALVTECIQGTFVNLGIVADTYIYSDHEDGGQIHAHVTLATRLLTTEHFSLKELTYRHKQLLFTWCKDWADYCNSTLAKHNYDIHIDHHSLKTQGIELEPQDEIRSLSSLFYQTPLLEHQNITQHNGKHLLKDLSIAFKVFPQGKPCFFNQNLVQPVHYHSATDKQFMRLSKLWGLHFRSI